MRLLALIPGATPLVIGDAYDTDGIWLVRALEGLDESQMLDVINGWLNNNQPAAMQNDLGGG